MGEGNRGEGEAVSAPHRFHAVCSLLLHRNEQGICDLYATARAAAIYAAVVKPASHNLSVHSCQARLQIPICFSIHKKSAYYIYVTRRSFLSTICVWRAFFLRRKPNLSRRGPGRMQKR